MSPLMSERPSDSSPPPIKSSEEMSSEKLRIEKLQAASARSFSVLTSTSPSQFIDFYQLLGEPENASSSRLRARMAELYAEAQSNREHRNPNTRRRYSDLLEILPKCRAVLLDEARRAQYDEYIIQSRLGASDVDFRAFIQRLTASDTPRAKATFQNEAADSSPLLGIRDDAGSGKSEKSPAPLSSPSAPAQSQLQPQTQSRLQSPSLSQTLSQSLSHHSQELQRDAALHLALMLRMASACGVGVFFIVLVVLRSALRESLPFSLCVAFVMGAAAWFGARAYLLRCRVPDETPPFGSHIESHLD